MKKTINDVLVVEGTGDASYISTFVEALIIATNGYEMPEEELNFLRHLPEGKKAIILTDSDEAGYKIRKVLNDKLDNLENIYVDISKCNKNNKHGVAECDKEELLKVLEPYVCKPTKKELLTTSDLLSIGIDSKAKREYIAKELHLGKCNNKTLLKRLNYLQISLQNLDKIIKNYGN